MQIIERSSGFWIVDDGAGKAYNAKAELPDGLYLSVEEAQKRLEDLVLGLD